MVKSLQQDPWILPLPLTCRDQVPRRGAPGKLWSKVRALGERGRGSNSDRNVSAVNKWLRRITFSKSAGAKYTLFQLAIALSLRPLSGTSVEFQVHFDQRSFPQIPGLGVDAPCQIPSANRAASLPRSVQRKKETNYSDSLLWAQAKMRIVA